MGTCTGRDGGACGGRDSRQTGCRSLRIACDVHTHTLFSRHAYSTIEENVHVTGDREWLERLVRILMDNACKYAGADTTVLVALSQHGRAAHLSVTNMGTPIDPEDLPHLFDRFYRSDKARARTSQASGFGLGLAIAKGIVEAHGGSISVKSDQVEGTTFSVTIPIA